ncbi:ImmA/IrrE family metallo-endopeptidase [Clostridioides mangenotii]|uniref:ImmA/IrrE family metallo-endopeptidase n=1 Tax=Metaclostridioides mangenotii TaxID=1540 RepID=UPI001C0FD586|nr:ImmA/IrrE family metallo-endopeptidase [Clostridioides mangenotii]
MRNNIKVLVNHLIDKFNTNDPFSLSEHLNINIIYTDLKNIWGMYRYIKRNSFIFINNNISDIEKRFVLSHELGHAILHTKNNCFYLKHNTFMKVSTFENEANEFAAELLITNEDIKEAIDKQFSIEQMACYFEVPLELVEFKFNHKI